MLDPHPVELLFRSSKIGRDVAKAVSAGLRLASRSRSAAGRSASATAATAKAGAARSVPALVAPIAISTAASAEAFHSNLRFDGPEATLTPIADRETAARARSVIGIHASCIILIGDGTLRWTVIICLTS
jgi:hypothetical protein